MSRFRMLGWSRLARNCHLRGYMRLSRHVRIFVSASTPDRLEARFTGSELYSFNNFHHASAASYVQLR